MWYVLGVLALFIAVLVVRALAFRPKAQRPVNEQAVEFDRDGAVLALQKLVPARLRAQPH